MAESHQGFIIAHQARPDRVAAQQGCVRPKIVPVQNMALLWLICSQHAVVPDLCRRGRAALSEPMLSAKGSCWQPDSAVMAATPACCSCRCDGCSCKTAATCRIAACWSLPRPCKKGNNSVSLHRPDSTCSAG